MNNPSKQRGATLIISLIMLLLLTLIAVSTIETSSKEEKMANNLHDHTLSFNATETVIVDGEKWLLNLTSEPIPVASCATLPCVISFDSTRYLEDQTLSWWQANGATISGSGLMSIKSQPRHVIEFYRFVPDDLTIGHGVQTGNYFYRITGYGSGSSDNSVSVIQTTVARRF